MREGCEFTIAGTLEVPVHTQGQEGEGRCWTLILGAASPKLLPPKQAFLCPPTRQRHQQRRGKKISLHQNFFEANEALVNIKIKVEQQVVYTWPIFMIDL